MFTGLIEQVGVVQWVRRESGATKLAIRGEDASADIAIGDSIAVDGTCLTVTMVVDGLFEVDLSDETLVRTTLGDLAHGDRVNLERPCRPMDRLGGHIVAGHIDGVGTILEIQERGGTWWFAFSYPEALRSLLVEKGSIAVDGISLTIAGLSESSFGVAIIPHTYRHTTLGTRRVGQRVNLEADLIGKYVIRYLEGLRVAGKDDAAVRSLLREPRYV
jgi:riboflavin synthase